MNICIALVVWGSCPLVEPSSMTAQSSNQKFFIFCNQDSLISLFDTEILRISTLQKYISVTSDITPTLALWKGRKKKKGHTKSKLHLRQ